MNKKGQVVIFVILGIVVILAIALSQFLSSSNKNASEAELNDPQNVDAKNVQLFVEGCLRFSVIESVPTLLYNGLYKDMPSRSLTYSNVVKFPDTTGVILSVESREQVPYYMQSSVNFIPTLKTAEEQLALIVKDKMQECVANLSNAAKNSELKAGSMSFDATIGNNVVVKMNYPLDITTPKSVVHIEDFSETLDYDVKQKYDYASLIVEDSLQNPKLVNLGFIAGMAYDKKFNFTGVLTADRTIIYKLEFNDYAAFKDVPILYNFAIQYDDISEDLKRGVGG